MKYALIHRSGCKGVAFHLDHRPQRGEALRAAGVTTVDGRQPNAGEPAICGTCGLPAPTNPDWVVEVIEFSIPLLLPSLNQMAGAGKGHWTAWQKEKKLWTDWIKVAKSNQLKMWDNPRWERARIEIDRYCVQDITDADNLRSGTKHLLDGLVTWGFIKDDKQACIGEPVIRQIRCKRKDEPRTVVRIYPLDQQGQDPQQQAQGGQIDARNGDANGGQQKTDRG